MVAKTNNLGRLCTLINSTKRATNRHNNCEEGLGPKGSGAVESPCRCDERVRSVGEPETDLTLIQLQVL